MNELKEKNETVESSAEDDYSFDSETSGLISRAIERKNQKRAEEASRKKRRIVILSCAAAVSAIAAVYAGGWAASMGAFLPNTYINGIDVSKMSAASAAAALQKEYTAGNITIKERGGKETIFLPAEFGYTFDAFSEVREIYKNVNRAAWIASYFKDSNYETSCKPEYDEEMLRKLVERKSWGSTETSNAELVHGENGYYIREEVYGDKADTRIAAEYILSQAAQGNFDIDLEKSGCYTEPTVFSADLSGKLKELNSKFNYVIEYDFGYTKETLTGAQVYEWMKDGGVLDKKQVEKYVDSLAEKYDTFMTTRQFKTTERGVITMSQGRYSTGQYGWWTDREKTVIKLLEYIDKAQSVTVEPEYVQLDTGYTYRGFDKGRSPDGDIGNTYIEVDLSAQHLWYYADGELKFETGQIVSGKESDPKRKTPEGFYSVYKKNENYTMKAADGSYTAKCKYFMRVSFEGIGFHDYSRSAYGGTIYRTNGSHGCINMKYDEVKTLYETVEWGTPVIFYY